MFKHFFSVLIFLFIFSFVFFIISTYFSDKNQKKIILNRKNIYSKIEGNLSNLPLLKNDTHDIIEFNYGYENDGKKIKRNFWNLFKKND